MKKMIMPILAGLLVSGTVLANFPTTLDASESVTVVRDELRLSLFPNPNNTGFVKVVVDNLLPRTEKVEVAILRPDGRPAFSEVYNLERDVKQFVQGIELRGFEPGIYTVRVTLQDRILRQRLVVR